MFWIYVNLAIACKVDLIFIDGINWQAFLSSFKNIQFEYNSNKLNINAIEKKSNGVIVVSIEVLENINKADLENKFRKEYDLELKALEEKYRLQLNAKDKEVEIYKQKSVDLLEIIKLAASRPINITQTQGNNMASASHISIENGNYNERIGGNFIQKSKLDENL